MVTEMEASGRKRKLSEIDKNIPFLPHSLTKIDVLRDVPNTISTKVIKIPKFKTPKGCENIIKPLPTDVEEFENPKFQRGNGEAGDRLIKSEPVNHGKTCDGRQMLIDLLDDRIELEKRGLSFHVIQPDPSILPDLSQFNISVPSDIFEDESTSKPSDFKPYVREIKMWFACDYIEDIVYYEFEKEKQYKLSEDFCKKYDVDPVRREILVDWLISVQTHLKAGNNTLHLAVSLLDILLDRIYIPYKLLQVSAIAAFWVAYKFINGNLNVKRLISLCAGIPTRDMILDYEILVLESSRLLQAGGDMSTFFNYLLFKLFGDSFPPEIYYCGQYFLEIMLTQFMFTSCSSCEKAITAVYAALAIFDLEHRHGLLSFTRFITQKKLKLMCCHLMKLVRLMYSDEKFLNNSALYRKYKSSRYFRISTHEVLKRSGST